LSRPLRVLIVEDTPTDVELMLRELRRAGFDPGWAQVQTEADYLEHLHPDLDIILSDYSMPQFSGLRALELLNERGLEIPFISVSGTMGEETAVGVMKQGAADYLIKDRLARLGPAVTQALNQSRLRKERTEAEEALKRQEEQYRVLFETNPSAMLVYELETLRILAVNDAAVEQYDYSREEFLARSLYDLRPPTEHERLAKAISTDGAASGYAGTWPHQRKDGSTILVDVYSSPTDFEGTPARIAVLVDVTVRHEAQIALRKEREFLAAVVDNVADGIVSCHA